MAVDTSFFVSSMSEGIREEGREQGRAEATAEAIPHLLTRRGIDLPTPAP